MYTSPNFSIRDEETFALRIPTDRDYKILQLTDLHLGFGLFSGKKDRLAMSAVTELIYRTKPDLIVLTGDSVFPFFPKSGTMNNQKQAQTTIVRWVLPAIRSSWRIFFPRENMPFLQKGDMSIVRKAP